MKLLVSVAILAFISISAGAQIANSSEAAEPKGKVKSVTVQRTYFVYSGQQIRPRQEVITTSLYDPNGRIVQASLFGNNGEQRITYTWHDSRRKASVSYYDLTGEPSPELATSFKPLMNAVSDSALCPTYSTRREKDEATKIERKTETCSDGSIRRSFVDEFNSNGDLMSETIVDANGRKWVYETTFGLNFKVTGFRYTVDDLIKPRYWQEVTFSAEQYDGQKNRISYMASSTHSSHPDRTSFQYLEETKITYYK